MGVQVGAILLVVVPVCAACAVGLLRGIDYAVVGWRKHAAVREHLGVVPPRGGVLTVNNEEPRTYSR